MNGFMRTFGLLVVAFIAFGCQGNKDVSGSAAPGDPAAAPDETQAAKEALGDSQNEPESAAEDNALVAQVQGLTHIKTVERTDAGIKITFFLEQAVTVDENSPPQVVSDAMMFAAFYTSSLLYRRVPEIDGLQQVFIYGAETIGDIHMTRASFESLGYAQAMSGAGDKAARRPVFRKLLGQLPQGAVDIKKKYLP